MTPAYIAKLGFITWKINVGAQKIDGSLLGIHNMVLVVFSLQNSLGRVQFFEKTFLLADISIKMVLKMPFPSLSNTDIKFVESKKLT